jgi:hypothetical protein
MRSLDLIASIMKAMLSSVGSRKSVIVNFLPYNMEMPAASAA